MKLLVVDDENDVQLLFQQKFRREIKSGEVEIHFALNGASALEMIESLEDHSKYLVLTDINMPKMNGIDLLKEIKGRYPSIKVYMITAYGDEENYKITKELGAEDYFTKPLQFDLLRERINFSNVF